MKVILSLSQRNITKPGAWFKIYPGDFARYNCDVPQEQWIGKTVLWGFEYLDNEWSRGKIKDLKKCNNYDAFIAMTPDGKLTASCP